jgi:glycosyltransferase involved in cell wall biosynthesis
MSIAVVVPTFRRPDDLRRCLDALAVQVRAPDEVVVVLRREDEKSRRVIESRPAEPLRVRQVAVSETGVVAALTAGLDAVRSEIVAITDDDSVPAPDWLARLERHYLDDARVGAVGGRDWVHTGGRLLDGSAAQVGLVRWYGRIIGNHHLGVGPARAVDVLKGVNMSFRAGALDGLRPDGRLLGSGAQVHFELGLCLALIHRGWTIVYDPAVAVDHYPAARFDEDARDAPSRRALAHAAHNELYLLLRWLPAWRRPFAVGFAFVFGSRNAPGVAVLAERLLREGNAPAVLERFAAAQRGRLRAIATSLALPVAGRRHRRDLT